jgi:hypothetical protein
MEGPTKLRRTDFLQISPQMTAETSGVDMAVPLRLQPSLGGSSPCVDWLDDLQRPATLCVYGPKRQYHVKGAALKGTDGYSVSMILKLFIGPAITTAE